MSQAEGIFTDRSLRRTLVLQYAHRHCEAAEAISWQNVYN